MYTYGSEDNWPLIVHRRLHCSQTLYYVHEASQNQDCKHNRNAANNAVWSKLGKGQKRQCSRERQYAILTYDSIQSAV